ncbi:RNA polymerase sigma factor [Spirosoma sp. BT704]|uniref:RNA polymerase sigma factor n=1 Tax=Spirosoma validum TaxID=2771355 RepID=A0A927GGY9_9BACT|nr:RNA polymerase sigma factor [Spirosoma validum]
MHSTDQQLWQGLCEGDDAALTAIFDRYHVTLYNYGRKLSSDSDLIKDAVQEVFIDIWRMRATLSREITSIKFYLYRALRRRLQRIQGKYQLGEDIQEIYDDETTLTVINEETVQIEEESRDLLRRRLQELLTQLPKRQVEALTLYYYDDFGIREIAQIMDVNEKSVRNFLHRGLKALRHNRNWLIGSLLILLFLINQ